MDGDAEDFDDVVLDEGTVDWRKGERMVDKKCHTTPSPIGAATVEEGVAWDVDFDV